MMYKNFVKILLAVVFFVNTASANTENCITGYACKINTDGKINSYENKSKSEKFSSDIKADKHKKKLPAKRTPQKKQNTGARN